MLITSNMQMQALISDQIPVPMCNFLSDMQLMIEKINIMHDSIATAHESVPSACTIKFLNISSMLSQSDDA